MIDPSLFDKMDFHLIRVLHTVLTERSVSRSAVLLGMHQPAVSAALRRLREIARDPLLVRAGASMVPTDAGLRMIDASAALLQAGQALFEHARGFDPAVDRQTFRIAATDYLGPQMIPQLIATLRERAPHCSIELFPLVDRAESYKDLAMGKLDIVLVNWFEPTDGLMGAPLFDDEVVSMVSDRHPARREGWTVASWLAADHVRPLQVSIYSHGIVDMHLDRLGLKRNCVVHCPHFGLIPEMVARSNLVVTAGRRFFERFTDRLPLTILSCPVLFPSMTYFQIWHARTDASAAGRWLREQIREAAAPLRGLPP